VRALQGLFITDVLVLATHHVRLKNVCSKRWYKYGTVIWELDVCLQPGFVWAWPFVTLPSACWFRSREHTCERRKSIIAELLGKLHKANRRSCELLSFSNLLLRADPSISGHLPCRSSRQLWSKLGILCLKVLSKNAQPCHEGVCTWLPIAWSILPSFVSITLYIAEGFCLRLWFINAVIFYNTALNKLNFFFISWANLPTTTYKELFACLILR